MTNAQRLVRTNEYDLLCCILKNCGDCPITIIGSKRPIDCQNNCKDCLQKWLNTEEERSQIF